MKCVRMSDVKKMEIAEIENPKKEEGKVLIRVNACGICGSDIHYWVSGEPKGLIMGHEFSGTVVDSGNRGDLKVGDRVTGLPISPCGVCEACRTGNPQYCPETWSKAVGLSLTNPGGYAEYINCRGDMVRRLPDTISDEESSMVEPSAVALHAVNLANIKVGEQILIIGGGIIGLMCAEFAKMNGASSVILLETNEKRGTKAVQYGKVDAYYSALDPNVIGKLKEKTKGGFDKVFECCGNEPAVTEAILGVKPGGTVVLVGVSTGPITIPTVISVMSEVKMQGAIAYTTEEFDTCIELIANKKINVQKYIDDVIPFEEAQQAFERLTSGEDEAIKIILKPTI